MEENNLPGAGEPKSGGVKGLIVGLAILIIAAGGYVLVQKGRDAQKSGQEQSADESAQDAEVELDETLSDVVPDQALSADGEVKTFTVKAENFSFSLAEIKVKKGDKVKIILNNAQGFHDWVVDEFNAKTKQFMAPGAETVEFTADKAGIFEYYCSVGKHREMGMKGKLIVE